MFCPNCKCEYKEGFNYCSDCNVELVNELPLAEDNKNQGEFSRLSKIVSNTIYYLLNGILGFIGCYLFLLFATIAATRSQPLPPDWEKQSKPNTSILFIVLLYLSIVIIINIMGIMSFTKRNKGIDSNGKILFKYILLNSIVFITSFIVFVLIGSIFWKF